MNINGEKMIDNSKIKLELAFLGDLSPSGLYSLDIDRLKNSLMELRESVSSTTTIFFNLECSLFEGSSGTDTQANMDAVRALAVLRPAIANLSNNHHFDTGVHGSQKIREILAEIGIPSIGLYRANQQPFEILNIESVKVAVVARIAQGTHPQSHGDRDGAVFFLDHVEVLKTCRELVNRFDFCIACLHWGAEYYLRPSPKQERLVKDLIDLGVDVIWGHHAHVLQDRIVIGRSLVMYNMGNAIFGQKQEGRWPKVCEDATMVGFKIAGKNRVFWERGFNAGIRGQILNLRLPCEIYSRNKTNVLWWPLAVFSWIGYRLYMEILVFGVRFLKRKYQCFYNDKSVLNPDAPNLKSIKQDAGSFRNVVQERLRRVVEIWEDE